ncbi:short-chain dehydrogenase/reductase [Arthroderma uncinatum]|uniref:short-chain dehydrogenase/reductase n=1 Tax=Arthroderma uncinatum TaxID=74035 RepID=UPI00144AF4B9|nr:short-chain dehydrogenase/reductase [Arthroderma uncinatum]KAF3490723.1 short-chain dehydrogenase/reductase [Arthroderma uncinatum]
MSKVTHRAKGKIPSNDSTPGQRKTDETQPQPENSPGSTFKELVALLSFANILLAHPLETCRLLALGIHQFGRQLFGYGFRPERDVIDQSGKVILITGGNIGLGRETVRELAKHRPARIYLAARNGQTAQKAIAAIKSELTQPVDIRHIPLDLSSFTSVREAARLFTAECDRLDTLILNAGVMGQDPYSTEDGYEIQFGTNYMGHFLLTSLLIPTLRETASKPGSDVRILSVSSIGWQMAPSSPSALLWLMTSTDELLKCNRWTRYGISKAANILLASELARRYPDIMSVSVHPGIILTALYDQGKASTFVIKHGLGLIKPFASSEKNGACNHLWAAGCERSQLRNGEYYTPVGIQAWENQLVHDEGTSRRLWEWSEEQVAER